MPQQGMPQLEPQNLRPARGRTGSLRVLNPKQRAVLEQTQIKLKGKAKQSKETTGPRDPRPRLSKLLAGYLQEHPTDPQPRPAKSQLTRKERPQDPRSKSPAGYWMDTVNGFSHISFCQITDLPGDAWPHQGHIRVTSRLLFPK